jgi:hypothetical protein
MEIDTAKNKKVGYGFKIVALNKTPGMSLRGTKQSRLAVLTNNQHWNHLNP